MESCAQGLSRESCAQGLSMETSAQCFAIESCELPRIGPGKATFGICPHQTVGHDASRNKRKLIHVSILQMGLWNNNKKRIIGLRFNIMLLLIIVRIYYVVAVCLNKMYYFILLFQLQITFI